MRKKSNRRRISICMAAALAASLLSGVPASAKKPVVNETSYYYEAEDGKRYGTAVVNREEQASGGAYVSELNFNHAKYDTTNKVKIPLKDVADPGRYKVSLYYSSGTNGAVILSANGRKQSVSYSATGSWEWNRRAVSANVELKGNGRDALVIADGPEGFMWLDAVQVTYIGKPAAGKTTKKNRYEAEDATIGKLAFATNNSGASGGCYVHELNFMGVGSDRQAYVQFDHLAVRKAGTYKMKLHFSSASDGRAYAYVNGAKYPYYKDYRTTHYDDWGTWDDQTVTMKIYLKGNGKDKIRVHDRVGYMWLDYMTLRYVSSKKTKPKAFQDSDDATESPDEQVSYTIRKEAENGILTKEVNIASEGKASGGAFINNLNYSSDPDRQGSVTFSDLGAAEAGTYRLRMAYNSAAQGRIRVIVNNNGKAYEAGYESTHNGDWGVWITQYLTVDIPLTGKNDTITIYNREGYMWLDYIELGILRSQENAQTTGTVSVPSVGGSGGSGYTSGSGATLADYNGGFEASHKYWTFEGSHGGINGEDAYYKSKVWFYAPDAFEQAVYETVSVPNGYYYVQAKTKQSVGTPEVCQMQIRGYDGENELAVPIARSSAYVTTRTDAFEVKDGKMQIRFYEKAETGANLQIDNIVIVPLQGPAAQEEPENRMDGYNGTFDAYTEETSTSYAVAGTDWEFAETTLWADHGKNGSVPARFTLRPDDHIRISRGEEWVWIDWIELENTADQSVYRIEAEEYAAVGGDALVREGNGATYVYSDTANDLLVEIPTAEPAIPEGSYTIKVRYIHQGSDSAVIVETDDADAVLPSVRFDRWDAEYGVLDMREAGGAVDNGRYAVLTSDGGQTELSQARSGFVPGSTFRAGAWVRRQDGTPGAFRFNGMEVPLSDDWTYVETAGVVSNAGRLSLVFQLDGAGTAAAAAIDEVVLYGEPGEYHPQTYHFEAENYAMSKVGQTGSGVQYAYADNEHDPLVEIPLTDVAEGTYQIRIHYSYCGNDTWVNLAVGSLDNWYQIAGTSPTEYDIFEDYTFTSDGADVTAYLSERDTLKLIRGGEWIWIDYIELIPQ